MSITLQKVEIDGHTVQLFQDEEGGAITGYSFAHDRYYSDPLDQLPPTFKPVKVGKTKEEIDEELAEIRSFPTHSLDARCLREETLLRFAVKTGLSEADGTTITTMHFPYRRGEEIKGYETKLLEPKKFWRVGDTRDVDFFGWKEAIESGSPKLFITEGPLDAVSLYQILKANSAGSKWSYLTPAVVSIPNGAGSAKGFIVSKLAEINKHFESVVLVFDMDEAGKKAAEEVVKVVPQAMVAELPMKDVNECLMDNRIKSTSSAVLFRASKPKNTRILTGSSLSVAAKKKPEMGLAWPWQAMTSMTKGIRRGETCYFGAGVKQGKSILLSALASDIMVTHDSPVLIAKPEEAVVKTYQELVAQVAHRRFNDPEIEFDEQAYDQADAIIKEKAYIIDAYQFVDWDTLRGDIRYSVVNDGVKDVYIDPISCLINQLSTSEANEFLTGMSAEIAAMTKDLGFTAYLFSHLRAPTSGEPHERGGKVQSYQFVNSRGMMRSCHTMWGLQGNRDPDLQDDERNMRQLVLLEDREFGQSGYVNLFWNKNSGNFEEVR